MTENQSVVQQVSRHADWANARKGFLGSCLSPWRKTMSEKECSGSCEECEDSRSGVPKASGSRIEDDFDAVCPTIWRAHPATRTLPVRSRTEKGRLYSKVVRFR